MTHLVDQGRQVQLFGDELSSSGIGEQLTAQLGRAAAGGLDLLDVDADGRFFGQGVESDVRVAEDGGEQVVEVVRDDAGQNAETLELLCVQDLTFKFSVLFFGALAVRDIERVVQV